MANFNASDNYSDKTQERSNNNDSTARLVNMADPSLRGYFNHQGESTNNSAVENGQLVFSNPFGSSSTTGSGGWNSSDNSAGTSTNGTTSARDQGGSSGPESSQDHHWGRSRNGHEDGRGAHEKHHHRSDRHDRDGRHSHGSDNSPQASNPGDNTTPQASNPGDNTTPQASNPGDNTTPQASNPGDNTTPQASNPGDNTTPQASNPGDNTTPQASNPGDNTTPQASNPGDNTTPQASNPGDNTTPQASNPGDNTTPQASTPGTGFQIQNGQLRVNGQLLAGVAVTGEYAQQVGAQALADQISSQFPGVNVVRLATSPEGGAFTNGSTLQGGETIQNIDQTIQALNAKGIAVIVDNHGSDANTPNNVSQTGNEAAWFAQIASDNLGNNMVMFQTENEPTGSNADIVAEQQAAYNAIRGTGSNAVVAFDLAGGGWAGPQESATSTYDAMSRYVIDAHAYASNNSDPASATAQEIAQTSNLTEADGSAVPVYIGETGNSIDGSNIDPAATAQLQTDMTDGTGAIAWLYDGAATGFGSGNGADHLTNSDGSLTSFGQQWAALVQQGAS